MLDRVARVSWLRPRMGLASAVGSLLFLGCAAGEVTEGPPPGTKPDTTATTPPTGTVQRGSVAVQVSIDPADTANARLAGVSVAGLTVTLLQSGRSDPPRILTTDATGRVRFEGLLQGGYSASVTRTLSAAEIARLPASERDASVFAGGATGFVTPGANIMLTFPIVGARRGGLIISEMYSKNGPPIAYPWGDYLEVYNNGDTTAYLDGLWLAATHANMHDDLLGPCTNNEQLRLDASRVWTRQVLAFPGSGREFPVPPGEARVIAFDAINHAAASGLSDYDDLSHAQFEQVLTDADTDNPIAANMQRIIGSSTGSLGRGYTNSSTHSFILLQASDSSQWTTATIPNLLSNSAGLVYTGIPAVGVLDVFSYSGDPVFRATFGLSKDCTPWIAPAFDRGVANIYLSARPEAIRRKSLGVNAAGREILQRTKNSNRDLEYGPRLKRSLNK
jgi:hypothetical protein